MDDIDRSKSRMSCLGLYFYADSLWHRPHIDGARTRQMQKNDYRTGDSAVNLRYVHSISNIPQGLIGPGRILRVIFRPSHLKRQIPSVTQLSFIWRAIWRCMETRLTCADVYVELYKSAFALAQQLSMTTFTQHGIQPSVVPHCGKHNSDKKHFRLLKN